MGQFGNVAKFDSVAKSGNRHYNERYLLQKRQLYCKMGQVLQIGTRAIRKWGGECITKWNNHYCKVGQLLIERPYTFVTLGQYVY